MHDERAWGGRQPSTGGGGRAARDTSTVTNDLSFTKSTKDLPLYKTFEEMGLKEPLLRGLYQYGFEKPSAIQQRAIVPDSARRTPLPDMLTRTVCARTDTPLQVQPQQ